MKEYEAGKAAREMAAPSTAEAIDRVARQEVIPRCKDYFISDDDEAGVPWENFVTALQVWTWMRDDQEQTTVRRAAKEFMVTDEVIREAVEFSPWMYLDGPSDDPTKQSIGHDGA